MTFRTFDIESPNAALTRDATTSTDVVRNLRSRRRVRAMSHRTSGCRIAGFGF